MRLWSLDPKFLDRQGLLACWREGLLAQAVLLDKTKGYKNHPQLQRFRNSGDPVGAIGKYLLCIYQEGVDRGYLLKYEKIYKINHEIGLPVTAGQIAFEIGHLNKKLKKRHGRFYNLTNIEQIRAETDCCPMFYVVTGDRESWEKG